MILGLVGCQAYEPVSCELPSPRILTARLTDQDFERLFEAPRSNRERLARVREFLSICPNVIDERINGTFDANISCRLPGKSTQTIVVGAHYDRIGNGQGVADNWTGILLLSKLLEATLNSALSYTWEFVAFGAEEVSLEGSLQYVRKRDMAPVVAMINLDTLGLKATSVERRSDRGLACLARETGKQIDVEVIDVSLRKTSGDWEAFQRADVPVLNLMSLDRSLLHRIHTRYDNPALVDRQRLDESWRLIVNLQHQLDQQTP